MKKTDLLLEQHFAAIAKRPRDKLDDTITRFDRNIFWYNRDEISRQAEAAQRNPQKTTYEDHRRVVETAVNMMGKSTQHEIAMCILTHRYFATYRNAAFSGKGDFIRDYSFIIKKVGMLFNPYSGRIKPINIQSKLKEFTKPTVVQINHIAGTVKEIKVPSDKFTLNEWAIKFNNQANESTTYRITGLNIA